MAHHCPTCSEPCYCMGDYSEIIHNVPYCKHCAEYDNDSDDFDTDGLSNYPDFHDSDY